MSSKKKRKIKGTDRGFVEKDSALFKEGITVFSPRQSGGQQQIKRGMATLRGLLPPDHPI